MPCSCLLFPFSEHSHCRGLLTLLLTQPLLWATTLSLSHTCGTAPTTTASCLQETGHRSSWDGMEGDTVPGMPAPPPHVFSSLFISSVRSTATHAHPLWDMVPSTCLDASAPHTPLPFRKTGGYYLPPLPPEQRTSLLDSGAPFARPACPSHMGRRQPTGAYPFTCGIAAAPFLLLAFAGSARDTACWRGLPGWPRAWPA